MKKNKIIYLSILIVIILSGCSLEKKEENTKSNYIPYSNGRVFIGKQDYLDNINNLTRKDILILDERDKKDPNIKIYNSIMITNNEEIEEILNLLLEYEEKNPSNWNRTFESMKTEWYYHNIAYYLNYKRERTKDVDLNNNDENKYISD